MEIKNSIRNIDPDAFLDAKLYAVETGRTLGQIISEAIDLMLHDPAEVDQDDDLVTQSTGLIEMP